MLTGINAGGDVSLSVCCVYYADTFKKCFDDVFHFDQQHSSKLPVVIVKIHFQQEQPQQYRRKNLLSSSNL